MRNFRTLLLVMNVLVMWLSASLARGQIQGITFTTLAAFDATNNGANPYDPPVLGADGNMYGTLPYGGTNAGGVGRLLVRENGASARADAPTSGNGG